MANSERIKEWMELTKPHRESKNPKRHLYVVKNKDLKGVTCHTVTAMVIERFIKDDKYDIEYLGEVGTPEYKTRVQRFHKQQKDEVFAGKLKQKELDGTFIEPDSEAWHELRAQTHPEEYVDESKSKPKPKPKKGESVQPFSPPKFTPPPAPSGPEGGAAA